jgi:hypothetical protein
MILPVLTPPRQRLGSTDSVSVTQQKQPKTQVTDIAPPKIQQSQTHKDECEQQIERCQTSESMDTVTVGNRAEPITPHVSEKKKRTKYTNKSSHHTTNTKYLKKQKTKISVTRSLSLPITAVIWKKYPEVWPQPQGTKQ